MKITIFDIEADSLTPTKIHVLSAWQGGKGASYTNYDSMRKLLSEAECLVGHKITSFDIPVLERLLGIKIKARLIDTLALSWYLYPDRLIHGLDEWGKFFGIEKPPIEDWENLPLKEYVHRCEEDVKITLKLWEKASKHLIKLYGNKEEADRFIKYLQFKMDCAAEQEQVKWKLDVDKAKASLKLLEDEQNEKLPDLIKAMPKVPEYIKKTKPLKPYKKDGTLSVGGVKWFSLLKKLNLPDYHDEEIKIVNSYKEPNPNSGVQVKNWLFSLGWVPQNFVYKRDRDTGDVRKIPQVKSEADDGTLCDSVMELCDKEPSIALLAGMGLLTHRIGFFKSFLSNQENGYVKAEIGGLTNTLRFKHKAPCANIPKVGVPWGEEIRGSLICDEGYLICGSDMSSLEDRTKLHYMFDYDPDYVAEMSKKGFDPHLDLALVAGKLSAAQVQAHKDGIENYGVIRHIYKTANYACIYGVGSSTLARQAKISTKEADDLIDVYWKRNWSVKQLAKDTVTKKLENQMWLYNPVSRFWYSLRYEKDIFSTLNQGTGVYAFDTWVRYVRSKGLKITAQFHDEIVIVVKEKLKQKCEDTLRWAITKTNEQLKLNRELDIDIKFGNCYADVH